MHETNFINGIRLENLKNNSGLLAIDSTGVVFCDTSVAAISAGLQNQINNIQSNIVISGGPGVTTSLSGNTWTISIGNGIQGRLACDNTNVIYTITHPEIDVSQSFPIVSLDVPTSGSDIFVQGVFNRSSTSFQVVLSGIPTTSYGIMWHISAHYTTNNIITLNSLPTPTTPGYPGSTGYYSSYLYHWIGNNTVVRNAVETSW